MLVHFFANLKTSDQVKLLATGMTQTTPNHKLTVSGWAAHDPTGVVTPYTFKRRVNGEDDVSIKILYCGVCHTDIHHVKNDWGNTMYPVVPGHEITGVITEVGSNVKGFKLGDRVGVGCLAASCLTCESCKGDEEHYCEKVQFSYNGIFGTVVSPMVVIPRC